MVGDIDHFGDGRHQFLDLDLDAVLVFELATHTERPGLIVSSAAVFDVYGFSHRYLPCRVGSDYRPAVRARLYLFVPSDAGHSLRSICLFPQTPGACSACLASAPWGAPAPSHRSAAASLSPPNACSPLEQGTFHDQLRRFVHGEAHLGRRGATATPPRKRRKPNERSECRRLRLKTKRSECPAFEGTNKWKKLNTTPCTLDRSCYSFDIGTYNEHYSKGRAK